MNETADLRVFDHWHYAAGIAAFGPNDSDGYPSAHGLIELAEALSIEVDHAADEAHGAIIIHGSMGQYEAAWHEFELSQQLINLAHNLSPARMNAPLYVDNPALWEETFTHLVNEHFPLSLDHMDANRLYVWQCPQMSEVCEHVNVLDEHDVEVAS